MQLLTQLQKVFQSYKMYFQTSCIYFYETVGWHRQLSGHEFEQALGDSEGQGSLVCCRS